MMEVLKRLKQTRAQVTDLTNIEHQMMLKECNAGSGIICTGTQGLLMSMFAKEVVGNCPATHLQHHMDIAIGSLKECYGDESRDKISDGSNEQA